MKEIIIHEVGLRDGLQMEKETVPTAIKVKLANRIIESGVKLIQLGSFVHPKRVPQMADTDDLFKIISGSKPEDVVLSGLVLNEKGVERGLACDVDMFCMGVSASETHSNKNTGMGVDEATGRICRMAKDVMDSGKLVQASVQSAFGCGFEGKIDEEKVLEIINKYLDSGVRMISLADTAGHANPIRVERMFGAVSELSPDVELAAHFHNTFGMGLANVYAAYKSGVRYIETAFGGLGGCPFTKSASGNVATEDVVHMFRQEGMLKELDLNKMIDTAKYCEKLFGKELSGIIYKMGAIN